jgi:hypothetical protein
MKLHVQIGEGARQQETEYKGVVKTIAKVVFTDKVA